jgi:putative ABC transport system permease protein
MLTAYTVLTREIGRNYQGTRPASAQLVTERVDEEVVAGARQQAGVADAEAASVVRGRAVGGSGTSRPLLLFVIPDFRALRINTVRLVSGTWPIADRSVVLERTALDLAGGHVGEPLEIELPGGARHSLQIAGSVHDPALAPAWQEQTVYGYVTAGTLATFGGRADLTILKLVVADRAADAASIEATATRVARWLEDTGRPVREIRVPPPRLHPHQAQMTTVLAMLVVFSVIGLALGSVLAATIVQGLLAQHVRDIAVMKAVGARTSQIAALYLALVAVIALTTALGGTALGIAGGRVWVSATAQLLNLEIGSYAPSFPFLVAGALVSMLVPLAAALVPVARACRRTVRDAIDDVGVSRAALAGGVATRWLARLRVAGPAVALGVRNAFRRRSRLAFTVLLIAAAGGVFIASASLRAAWNENIAAAAAARHYDLELGLQAPASTQAIVTALGKLPGVRAVESWPASAADVDHGNHVAVSSTYPDEGHGRLTLRAVPPSTRLVDRELSAGRWLRPDDGDVVVLNSAARALAFPNVAIGDTVDLLIRQRPRRFRVVGIVREVMTPAAVYATMDAFAGADFARESTNALRIALVDRDQADHFARQAAAVLERGGIPVRTAITETAFRAAQGGHISVLVYALASIALAMAIVGGLGLASMLSTSVTERTREFGILRSIGASAAQVRRVILAEALVAGILGALLAVPASMPLSTAVGRMVGRISLQPLQLTPDPVPVLVWSVIAIAGSVLAGLYPAVRAARLTVRETLAIA